MVELQGGGRHGDDPGPLIGDNARPHEGVPLIDGGDEGQGGQGRSRGRDDDAREDAHMARPVDPRRVDELAGHGPEALAQQEDGAGRGQHEG